MPTAAEPKPAEKKAAPAPATTAPAPSPRPVADGGAGAGVPAFLRVAGEPGAVVAPGLTAAPALSAVPQSRVAALLDPDADPGSPAADPGPNLIRAGEKGVAPPGARAAAAPKAGAPVPKSPAPGAKSAGKGAAAAKSAGPAKGTKGAKSVAAVRPAAPVIPRAVLREAAVKAEAEKREAAAKSAAEAGVVAERLYTILRSSGVSVPAVMGLLSGRSPSFAAQVMEAYSFSGAHLRAMLRQRLGVSDAIKAYALLADGHLQHPHVGLARALIPAGTRDAELFRLLYAGSLATRQRMQAGYDRAFGAPTGFPLGTGSLKGDLADDLSGWRLQKAQALLTRDLTPADELYFDSVAIEGTHTGAVVNRLLDLWDGGPQKVVDLADEWDRIIRKQDGWTDLSLREAMESELSGDDWAAVKTVLDGADRYRKEVPKDEKAKKRGDDRAPAEAIRLDVADRLLKVATTERMGTDEALMYRAVKSTRAVHGERIERATGKEKKAAEAGWKAAQASLRAVVAEETTAGGADHRKARLLLADELKTVDELYLAAADANVDRAVELISAAWAEDRVDDLLIQARRPRVDAEDGAEIRPSFNPRIVAGGQATLNAFRVDAMLKHGTRVDRGATRLHWELEAGTGDADLAGAVAFLKADGVSDDLRKQVIAHYVRTRLTGGRQAADPAKAFIAYVEGRYGNTPAVAQMRDLAAPAKTPAEVLERAEKRHAASASGLLNTALEGMVADYDRITGEDTLEVEAESLERLRFIAERAGASGPELTSMMEMLGLSSPDELAQLEYGLFTQRLDEVRALKRTVVDTVVATVQLAVEVIITAATGGAAAPLFFSSLLSTAAGIALSEMMLGEDYQVATKENATALVTVLATHGMGAGVKLAVPADAAARLTRMQTLVRTAGTEALSAVGVGFVTAALEPKVPSAEELTAQAIGIALNATGGGIKAAIPVGLPDTATRIQKLRASVIASIAQNVVAGNTDVTTGLIKAPEDLSGAELAERYLKATGIGFGKGVASGTGEWGGGFVEQAAEPTDEDLAWHPRWVAETEAGQKRQAEADAAARAEATARAEAEAQRVAADRAEAERVELARAAAERAAEAARQADAARAAEEQARALEQARTVEELRAAEAARLAAEQAAEPAADPAASAEPVASSEPAVSVDATPPAAADASPAADASAPAPAAAPKRKSTPTGKTKAMPARTGSRGGYNTELRRAQKRERKAAERREAERLRMAIIREANARAETMARAAREAARKGKPAPAPEPLPEPAPPRSTMSSVTTGGGRGGAPPPRRRSALDVADEHRVRHQEWSTDMVRLGRMPGQAVADVPASPASVFKAGTLHRTPGEAYAEYMQRLAETGDRKEVGIFRNIATGEYRVMVGEEGHVSYPAHMGWESVLHFHPNRDNVLVFRMPSPADVNNTILAVGASGHAITEFVEWPLPGGGRGRATFTVTPSPLRIYLEYRDAAGEVQVRSYSSFREYRAAWAERKRGVSAAIRDEEESARQGKDVDRPNPDYVDLMADTDRFFEALRAEQAAAAARASSMTGVPAVPPPDPGMELENPLDYVARESSHAPKGKRRPRRASVEEPDDPRWKLTRQDELTYVQYDPKINPEARWRAETRFTPPVGGGTMTFGPRSYRFDAAGNLTDAWTSQLQLGVRDPVMYDNIPGIQTGEDYGHLLGIDFGHVDAQLGHFGGFRQAAHVNRPTGEAGRTPAWYNAEREVLRLAVQAHKAGRQYLVIARADGHVGGRPGRSRIYLVVDGTVMFDSDWISNPNV
jgi:hypothetical protein